MVIKYLFCTRFNYQVFISHMYLLHKETPEMKLNFYQIMLRFLSAIGVIPTSLLQLVLISIFVVVVNVTAWFAYYGKNVVLNSDSPMSLNVIVLTTDLSFVFIGTICPFLNYLLQKNFPSMLNDPIVGGNTIYNLILKHLKA